MQSFLKKPDQNYLGLSRKSRAVYETKHDRVQENQAQEFLGLSRVNSRGTKSRIHCRIVNISFVYGVVHGPRMDRYPPSWVINRSGTRLIIPNEPIYDDVHFLPPRLQIHDPRFRHRLGPTWGR